jgi:elongation factor 1-gamma
MPELKSPEMLKLNPNGKMPILVTPDGPIYESKAMLRHLARLGSSANLYGSSSFE